MQRPLFRAGLIAAASLIAIDPIAAQIRVSPSSVNVNTQGVTTAVITFTGAQGTLAEGLFCGEVVSASPDAGQRCAPGTVFGQLPSRYQRTSGVVGTVTDVMTVPASVARRAYQDAAAGRNSAFYYVRRFRADAGVDEYAVVTLRLTNGGARTPLALTDVKLMFLPEEPVLYVGNGEVPSDVQAVVRYTGGGRLSGRWEIVYPGEAPPTEAELRTEGSDPGSGEFAPRRFTQLSRFNVFLPPTGKVVIPGPDATRLPTSIDGQYFLLLRIESAFDAESPKEGGLIMDGPEVILGGPGGLAGGVAPFPLPPLRYIVGSGTTGRTTTRVAATVRLRSPAANAVVVPASLRFLWMGVAVASQYRVEIGTPDGVHVFSALVPSTMRQYDAPAWLASRLRDSAYRWRVVALDGRGRELGRSLWSAFHVQGR